MVTYTSEQEIGSKVPLGGIGAGKIEIDNNGKMINLTIVNNWTFPIKEMLGSFPAYDPRRYKDIWES